MAAAAVLTVVPTNGVARCLGVDHRSAGFAEGDSAYCLSCHDSNIANLGGAGLSSGHRVGVDYQMALYTKRRLNPPSMLDERVRLFGGRIECETCHNLSSSNAAMLVMKNTRSALCLACHAL